jgi:large subunit ribosomal protein L3
MSFILGTKEEMTQLFDENGVVHAATVIAAGPVKVTQVKEDKQDGYAAVQVGYGTRREKNLSRAVKGHTKDIGFFAYLREFNASGEEKLVKGDTINVSVFKPGDIIQVSAISKGKGFQGVVKRHGFHGGPRTHGQRHTERAPGSIGATGPQRVFKGKKMAGRMGGDRVTVKNLKVLAVDKENNKLFVSGSVPGRRGTLVEVREVVN